VKKQWAYDSNSHSVFYRCLEFIETKFIEEEKWNQNLNKEHNEALLKSKALLEWWAAFGHIGTNGIVIYICWKFKTFVFLEILFFNDDILIWIFVVLLSSIGLFTTTRWTRITCNIILFVLSILFIDFILVRSSLTSLLFLLFLHWLLLILLTLKNHGWLLRSLLYFLFWSSIFIFFEIFLALFFVEFNILFMHVSSSIS